MKKIGFIGAGQMAQALVTGISRAWPDINFEITDPSPEAQKNFCSKVESTVEIRQSIGEVFKNCDVVFLAIKPQYFRDAIDREKIEQALTQSDTTPLVISIMAGINIQTLIEVTGMPRIARVMPNTPCLVMEGASAVSVSSDVSPTEKQHVLDLLNSVGTATLVDEGLIDSVTGLSGSGPAYVFTFIEALIDAGVLTGLSRAVARDLAIQTVIGSAKLVAETGEHPAVLRDRVTSPGGTTIAALKQLEINNFRASVIQAVEASTTRAKELGANS